MSEQHNPHEQAEVSAEQVLELKDLEAKNLEATSKEAEQVRGGGTTTTTTTGQKQAIEINDYGFGVSMPVSTSR